MRNDDQEQPAADEPRAAEAPGGRLAPSPVPPLLILASDDELVCVDDLCLPPDTRP